MASLTESECSVFEDPDFWLYYQQITLYNVLSARQPMFMRRNLKYVHKAKPAQGQDGEGSYTIEVTIHAAAGSVRGKSSVPPGLSLIVAVCERLSNGLDLNPVAARLLRLPSWDQTRVPGSEISNGEAGGSGGAADVSVRLSVPCTMHQPQIVFAVADAAPDFGGCFGKRNACTLTKCLNAGVCLGVFRPGDAVWTGTVPLDEGGDGAHTQMELSLCQANIGIHSLVAEEEEQQVEEEVRTLQLNPAPASLLADEVEGITSLGLTVSVRRLPITDANARRSAPAAVPVAPGLATKRAREESNGGGAGECSGGDGGTRAGDGGGNAGGQPPAAKRRKGGSRAGSRGGSRAASEEPGTSAAAAAAAAAPAPAGPDESPETAAGGAGGSRRASSGSDAGPVVPAARAAAAAAEAGGCAGGRSVLYVFMYAGDAKMARQCEPGYTCCLCAMSCCSYGGLQSHLLACHQYLSYDFLLPDGQLPPAAALGLVQSELSGVVVVRVPLSCFDRHTGRLLGRLERTYSAVEGQAVVNMFNTFVFHRSLKAPLDFPTGAAQMLHRIEPLPLPLPLPLQLPPLPLKALGTLALDARGERGGKQGGRGRGARGARGRGGAGTGSGRGSGLISAGSGAPEGISLDCRSYYHSRTAVPMPRQEAIGGVDTDDETDDDEYERSFKRDERDKRVTTASERRLMLMWNSFARAHPVFSDFVVKSRCIKFVEVNLTELRSLPSLRRGLLSFLMMLWDCALVESGTIDACIRLYDGTSVPQQEALQAAAAGQLTGGVGAGSGEGASGSGVSRGGGAGAAAQPQAVGA